MIQFYFYRYEIKFLINWKQYSILRRQIQPFVCSDSYCASRGSYKILSLYYDTPGYDCYYSKINGNGNRYKFRLRSYLDDDTDGEFVYVELKKKHGEGIFKKRLKLKKALLNSFFRSDVEYLREFYTKAGEIDIAKELLFYYELHRLKPSVYTYYVREAYIGHFEHRLRLTFDMRISCKDGTRRDFDIDSAHYIFNPHFMVLEIKGFNSIPLWLTNILNSTGLHRQRTKEAQDNLTG